MLSERSPVGRKAVCVGMVLFCLALVAAIGLLKYRPDTNYYNSDAPWHVMLTMQAYEETTLTKHKFLPLVSLGDQEDKWIPWGATVPDKEGNYYYTSFSPAGFALPYLFIKLFRLPINERSIYLYASCLFAISTLLTMVLFWRIFSHRNRIVTGIIVVLLYCTAPEILHGMGVAYWCQAIFQVLFPLQVLAFMRMKNSAAAKAFFYLLCIVNPYVEWTGYVANVGFVLASVLQCWGQGKKISTGIYNGIMVGLCTIGSLIIFVLHYLTVLEPTALANALKSRFFARNMTSHTSFALLLKGELHSFQWIFILIIILLVAVFFLYRNFSWMKRSCFRENRGVFLVMLVALLENVLMMEHAVSYSYDRMKLIWPLLFIVCDLFWMIKDKINGNIKFAVSFLVIAACSALNIGSYLKDRSFVWDAPYRTENNIISEYCMKTYDNNNSVAGLYQESVRGYTNLTFGRGVYEWVDMEQLRQIAAEKEKRYAMLIRCGNDAAARWNMYDFSDVIVYDREKESYSVISVSAGVIQVDTGSALPDGICEGNI